MGGFRRKGKTQGACKAENNEFLRVLNVLKFATIVLQKDPLSIQLSTNMFSDDETIPGPNLP